MGLDRSTGRARIPARRVEVRAARPGEAASLGALALRSKAYWGYSPEFLDSCRLELSVSEDAVRDGMAFVIEADGKLGGFYTLETPTPPRVELGHLFVEPDQIGRGLGRRLLDDAVRRARGRGFEILVIQGDPHAAPFYESCGARRIGTKPSASIEGRSLPLFELSLRSGFPSPL